MFSVSLDCEDGEFTPKEKYQKKLLSQIKILKRQTKVAKKQSKILKRQTKMMKKMQKKQKAAEKAAAKQAVSKSAKGFFSNLGAAICKALPAILTAVATGIMNFLFKSKCTKKGFEIG